MSEIELSIVMPALNEEKTVGLCVTKAVAALRRLGISGEVVVADNGSDDRTVEVAQKAGARVVSVEERGYGSAYMGGLREAKGSAVIIGDSDDSYNFEEIESFYRKLHEGYDFVTGNRFKGTIEPGAMPFLHRFLGTPVLTFVVNLFFGSKIGDVNCGMRAMTKSAFERMNMKTTGMEFATEMIIRSAVVGLKMAEVPCNLYRDKRDRKPHLRTWRDGWRHLRFMLLLAPQWTFFVPAFALIAGGLAGLAALVFRDLFFPAGLVWLDQKHMISASIMFLVGFQLFEMGLTGKVFAWSKDLDRPGPLIDWLNRNFQLEKGIAIGLGLVLVGMAVFAYLFITFYTNLLEGPSSLLRFDLAIGGMLAVFLGLQILFQSFLLSLFFLRLK